jgi:hypothetical protein
VIFCGKQDLPTAKLQTYLETSLASEVGKVLKSKAAGEEEGLSEAPTEQRFSFARYSNVKWIEGSIEAPEELNSIIFKQYVIRLEPEQVHLN